MLFMLIWIHLRHNSDHVNSSVCVCGCVFEAMVSLYQGLVSNWRFVVVVVLIVLSTAKINNEHKKCLTNKANE